ncbi:MAG: EAL domain-containing protein [Clostridiales bacterium]|nr:EAL domain-containing protein [Clostridiales bacterium]
MPKTNASQQNKDERQLILIVEDEFVSREILKMSIEREYDVLLAENGKQALEHIDASGDQLSLILLDLNLPDMHGVDILNMINEKEEIHRIPVIVLTADKEAEVECLDIGAADFIPKPYPDIKIIQARIRHTIELFEKRVIIGQTEFDELTGLYNREFFYLYAERSDAHNKENLMDAIVIDINHFHMINERYGRDFSDEVLKRIGNRLRDLTSETGGLACRRDADQFMLYCPHLDDYEKVLGMLSEGISGEGNAENTVRLRMGVYPEADKSIDIERRFDRAKLAADSVKSNYTMPIGEYDNELNEKNLYREQLIVAFPEALEQEQFKVYYQPKFDIRGEKPVLCSAEALVRWIHPEYGFINPGAFISTFESSGLINRLDNYVWRAAAKQIREWSDRLGAVVPVSVSVNVSRVDLFDPDICNTLKGIVEEYGISQEQILLEITESAYSEDSKHIIDTVHRLRSEGFRVEMDDFGTGYSSLNMLTSLPIDALKLDMQFIRTAFTEGGDTGMIAIVIEIAEMLGVPVIAEGVETEEQLNALKEMGCDIAQGYYFSKPVPAEEFEKFLADR